MMELLSANQMTATEAAPEEAWFPPRDHTLGCLEQILAEIEAIVPPLWPLRDYVAVNPFLGLSDQDFLNVRQLLCEVRDCDLLLPLGYFRELLTTGTISNADVETAYQQCLEEYPELYEDLNSNEILNWLNNTGDVDAFEERRFHTVAEALDQHQGSGWTSHIANDITRCCSAHYDEGQASWSSPWKQMPLYEAWREVSCLSVRMDMLGIPGFRSLVADLPDTPLEAIEQLLRELNIPDGLWRSFLLGEMFSVAGWASYIKYRLREAVAEDRRDDDLLGLLAMRLAYDVALARAESQHVAIPNVLFPSTGKGNADSQADQVAPPTEVLVRYTLQVAAETAYRQQLCQSLVKQTATLTPSARKSVQMVFCIDVRSEVLRRHLESVDESIETFGFAGFFGMALEYVPLGESTGDAHCPVLLHPGFRIPETLLGADEGTQASAISRRQSKRLARTHWKSFQTSAISCFSFVESLGLPYVVKLLTDSLRMTRPVADAEQDGVSVDTDSRLGPDIEANGEMGLPSEMKIELAEGMLRNLGLTENFGRIIALCGHAAHVTNNPYKSGLDCGACGGHSGEPNARVAAALLNDSQVRTELAGRGIAIPADTWFVPGVHNTTTDEIQFHDTHTMPSTHLADFQQLQAWVRQAGERSRTERATRLGNPPAADLFKRSRDWSEVRPEWGLAGNAAFVVAPRSRTAGLNLKGRAFMHSYDHRNDPDLKVLELIMTAPMIVTNWINLQYYAAVVDNDAFGSGNKVIHNVVGQMGVLLGNGGDLMVGLPWQSVHDGKRFQHEPLRLLVVIESSRDAVQQIIDRHVLVRDLVSNGWLSLVVLEAEATYRWTSSGKWQPELLGSA